MSRKFPIIVTEMKKNSKERIRFTVEDYRGIPVVNVRVWYLDENDTWKPGRQGLAMDVKKIREFSKAIIKVRKEAVAAALI